MAAIESGPLPTSDLETPRWAVRHGRLRLRQLRTLAAGPSSPPRILSAKTLRLMRGNSPPSRGRDRFRSGLRPPPSRLPNLDREETRAGFPYSFREFCRSRRTARRAGTCASCHIIGPGLVSRFPGGAFCADGFLVGVPFTLQWPPMAVCEALDGQRTVIPRLCRISSASGVVGFQSRNGSENVSSTCWTGTLPSGDRLVSARLATRDETKPVRGMFSVPRTGF